MAERLRRHRLPGFLFLLCLVGVLLAVSLASSGPRHGHDALSDWGCDICHFRHLPTLEASPAQQLPPRLVVEYTLPELPSSEDRAPAFVSHTTRAPPA